MKAVVFDTNMLLVPGKYRVNIDAELQRLLGAFQLLVSDRVVEELKGMKGAEAKIALQLCERAEVFSNGIRHADDAIVAYAREHDCVVATQDKVLKERIKALGRKVLVLRSGTHFEMM